MGTRAKGCFCYSGRMAVKLHNQTEQVLRDPLHPEPSKTVGEVGTENSVHVDADAVSDGSATSKVVDKVIDTNVVRGFRAQFAPRYLDLSLFTAFWIFVVASILGLLLEDIFHLVVYGGWESRAGLVWGPFSPIYGVGALALTFFLNRFYYTHDLVVFLIAMVVGATLEFCASWMMEYFWHAIAWDYTGTFGSIDGRTNFFFGVMWGALGLFWVRFILPVIKRIQGRFPGPHSRAYTVITWLLIVFMTVNAVVTVLAIHREGQRVHGVPPATQIDVVLDKAFPDEWLQQRFHNMTVSTEVGLDS